VCPRSQYVIDEFAERVHPRDNHPKIFAMIDAYLDESGIHAGALVCVVAGYFGGRGKWKKFEADWIRLLKRFDVPLAEFHAKDLFPEQRGWFKHHWRGSHPAFLEAIGDTIAAHPKIAPLSVGIFVEGFESFSLDERKYFTGGTLKPNGQMQGSASPNKPYFVPFQHVITRICEYSPVGGKAHFFFGLDRLFYGYASVLFEQMANSPRRGKGFEWKDRLGNPTYPLAKETPQLQAADFLANLTYHHMIDAGKLLGVAAPSPLLAKCIANRRSNDDFFFHTRENLAKSLDLAEEVFGVRPLSA
jgi:hypothetical protein